MSDNTRPDRTLIQCPQCKGHGYPPSTLTGFKKKTTEICPTCGGDGEVEWPGKPIPDPRMVRCSACQQKMPLGFHVCIYCGTPNAGQAS